MPRVTCNVKSRLGFPTCVILGPLFIHNGVHQAIGPDNGMGLMHQKIKPYNVKPLVEDG